jgi:hypothetical protein
MANFKITNITNTLAKRHSNHNTSLDIDYVDGFKKISYSLRPNEEFFITTNTLPLSVHKLRMKNLVTVVEISTKELTSNKKEKEIVKSVVVKETESKTQVETPKNMDVVEKPKSKKTSYTTTTPE